MPDRPSVTGVSQRGIPARLALSIFLIGFAAVIAVAVLGRGGETPVARSTEARPLVAATPLASLPWSRAAATDPSPSPASACVTPAIAPLADSMPRHPRELVPTGVRTVGALAGGVDQLVPDRDGGVWATSAGRLLRFDATGTLIRAWSFEDDPGLVGRSLAAARDGGVWLVAGDHVALFDGRRFQDVVDAPGNPIDLAEGPDRTLWMTVSDQGLFHWDGRIWGRVCGSPDDAAVQRLAVDRVGRVWVSFGGPWQPSSNDPARYDGRAWVSYPGAAGSPAYMVAADDGSVWALESDRLVRFDGASWRSVGRPGLDLTGPSSLAAAPDGSVWAAGLSRVAPEGATDCCAAGSALVLRYDGARWTIFAEGDGLPGPTPEQPAVSGLAVARGVAFAGAAGGLYRLEGGRWTRTWAVDASPRPLWISSIVGVSANEAWATGDPEGRGLWHLEDGLWTSVRVADWPSPPSTEWSPQVAAYGGGTLAVAGGQGVAVLADGRWTSLATGRFVSATVAEDGRTVYATGSPTDVLGLVAATFRLVDGRWTRTDVGIGAAGANILAAGANILAVDPAGRWWYAEDCSGSPCRLGAMSAGRTTEVPLPEMGKEPGISAVQTTTSGDVWVLAQSPSDDPERPGPMYAARHRDGAWQVTGASDGLVSAWSSRIVGAPDGSVWVAGDGLWRYDGTHWTAVRPGWFWELDFAPDGTAWAIEASGVAKLPADVVQPAPLSDAAATWCAAFTGWSAVHRAALALGIDEAAIDERTSAVLEARGPGDPATFGQIRRLDGEYARACNAAFSGGR